MSELIGRTESSSVPILTLKIQYPVIRYTPKSKGGTVCIGKGTT